MAVNTSARERQVAAVRDALGASGGRFTWPDDIKTYAMTRSGVVILHSGVWQLDTVPSGELRKSAYVWCVANGLQAEADAYNARALAAYRDRQRAALTRERERLTRELADVDAKLAALEGDHD